MKRSGIWTRLARMAAATAAVIALVSASVLLAAPAAAKAKDVPGPSYVIPNIAAAVMCIAALGIACKRFRRT